MGLSTEPNRFDWRGADIRVRARVLARRLWLAASIDVYLNGEPILRTNGRFMLVGAVATNFEYQGEQHKATVSWGAYEHGSGGFPYTLTIDGEAVAKSRVPVENPVAMWVRNTIFVLVLLGIAAAVIAAEWGLW